MERVWHPGFRRWAIAVGAGAGLLLGSHLWAQTPRSGGLAGLGGFGAGDEETSPRLHSGAHGEVLRLWQRSADPRAGGGAVFLAVAQPQDRWQTLLEIRSPEKGVTIRDAELAVGPGNEMAVVYRWWRNQPRAKQIRLARSDDGGKTWSQPAAPIDTEGKAFNPRVIWGRGKSLVVAWADERRGSRVFDIYARRSPDGGATWEPEQLLSRFPEILSNDLFARPELVGDGQDRLWAVWVGVKGGRSSLYLNRSVDAGRTWTAPVSLTGESSSVFAQSVLRAGEHLLLVWHDRLGSYDRVYAASSADGGVRWTAPARVDHLPPEAAIHASSASALLAPDGEALVAWQDARNGREDVFVARSADWGRTWGSEDRRMDMDDAGTGVSKYARLARARDGRVALAWDDDRAGHEAVYVRVRPAGDKAEWGPEVRLASPGPKLASRLPWPFWGADGQLRVAWEVWDHTTAMSGITKRIDGKTVGAGAR